VSCLLKATLQPRFSIQKETAAGYEAQAGLRQALFGNSAVAKQHAAAALAMTDGRDVQFLVAMTYAFIADNAKVQLFSNDFEKRFPQGTIVKFNYLPSLRAQQALLRHDSAKAIAELQAAAPYELGQPNQGSAISTAMYPVYIHAETSRATKRGKEAAVEYQKILVTAE
jgi:eukaryotic-like serine/threonine-protein kinase